MFTVLILASTMAARANIYTWTGGGTSGYWSDSGNWGFTGVPNNGDTLVFPEPTAPVACTNNLAGLTLALIQFTGSIGAYTISGNSFTLTGGIQDVNGFGGAAINNSITLGTNIYVDVEDNTSLTLGGTLQGSGGLNKTGFGKLIYATAGNNTYSGTTLVSSGVLDLNVSGANAYGGPLVIGDGSGNGSPEVDLLQGIETPVTQPVTVNLKGLFVLNDFTTTIGPLTLQGGTVSTGNGTLSLNGDLTVPGSTAESMINGKLHFNGGLHLVNVAKGSTFRALDLFANVSDSGGGLLFTNSTPSKAFALLEGTNSFTGPLTIDNMMVSVQTPSGLGTTTAGTTVGSHGTLFLYSTSITNESLTMADGATLYGQDNCTWAGPILLNGNVILDCYPAGATLTLLGPITGNGGFEKTDVGTLQLFGNAGNSYSGNTFIQAGTCLLDKDIGVAIPGGTLTIGDDSGSSAVVRDVNVGANLGSAVALDINAGGLLDLNGESEVVSPITLAGGTIYTGSGRLQIDGDIYVPATTNEATISGAIVFANGLRTITIDSSLIFPSLRVPATVADAGSGFKVVEGDPSSWYSDLWLQGSNSFTGPLTIDGAEVAVETPWSLGATTSGTYLTNYATLWLYQTAITNETVTLAAGTELAGQNNCIWNGPINLLGNAMIFNPSPGGFLFDIQGAITGTGNLTVSGSIGTAATTRFSGSLANTFAGTTTVDFTTLTLAKTAIGGGIPGNLVVYASSTVQLATSYQINSPFKSISLGDNSLFDLAGNNEWVGPVTMQGAQVTTGNGLLYMGGDITVNSSTVAMSQITGNATLWNGTRTINCTGHNYSPDLRIPANLGGNGNSGLIKTGIGEASLAGPNNTFPGPVTVNAGSLWAESNTALGNTSTPATINTNGNLFLFGSVAVGLKPLVLNSAGGALGELTAGYGQSSWAGNIILAANAVIDVYTNSTLELSGNISGPATLTKIDTGNLLLDGAVANNFTGTTLLQQGTLTLSKTTGPAISGPLTIGQSLDGLNGDVVKPLLNNQFSTSNRVSISNSGLLDLSAGVAESVGSLDGSGNVAVAGSTLNCGLDNTTTATFAGQFSGLASGALVKAGTGVWTLTGSSSFPGIIQVQGGKLFVNGALPSATASFINGAWLGGSGTVGPIGFNHGVLAPGFYGPGILNIHSGGVALNGNDQFLVNINGTTVGSGYSQLNVTGTVGLGNAMLQLNMPVVGATNSQYTIVNNDGTDTVTGTFASLPEGATATASNGAKFKISYHGGTGNDVVLTQISLPAQPIFAGISVLDNGVVQLDGVGMPNQTYSGWANTNLATTNWVDIGSVTANGVGTIQFTDPNASKFPQRFYRFSFP